MFQEFFFFNNDKADNQLAGASGRWAQDLSAPSVILLKC